MQNINDAKKLAFVDKNFNKINVPIFAKESARDIQILFVNILPGIYFT
jgi:hypothetical protein